ncbi:hypothetical protein [Desulfomonile tiedjei]|uniref:Uncharacterized protein n=1 Tax=Desulfomonile tiedjei (strain ATCC 49306 / DSM 6799 / DCB-1) TaxID=706587 RepID=I4CBV1_DESTA|nr:hypothetical protein [Desulfomonile tiedjei]AFM27042.1 hypothetical protein Desti_4410 [Desulfomonile tiedjei DSM 6799]
MSTAGDFDHILIREASVLVRVPEGIRELNDDIVPEYFDVRTGVPLKNIYPELQTIELHRGYLLSPEDAQGILRCGLPGLEPKVISILDVKQRRLDSVVADSVLDQLKVLTELFGEFLRAAEDASQEERYWLSQQVLGLLRKFSGRELQELQETVEWFRNRSKK